MRVTTKLIAFVVAAVSPFALAQTQSSNTPPPSSASSQLPKFDVVSIKRDKSVSGVFGIQSPPGGDTVLITNMSLRMLIGLAYDIDLHDAIFGLPSWADTENYDITAKVAEPDLAAFHKLLPRERNPMFQPVLADRFQLKAHYEDRQLPAYALVVAKGGAKLIAVQPSPGSDGHFNPGGIQGTGPGQITGKAAGMSSLASLLSVLIGRPVIDRTGLADHYNFTLQYAPPQASTDSQLDQGPSIFTAVTDQLGLKLESTKAPVPVLIVDHIDHPTEN
jgi:uncharacterized protein (TIGR03435 family)